MKIIKVEKQIRQAFSNNDLEKLMSLPNFDFNSKELNLYLGNLRIVLGQIISTLNSFSSIYKSYMDGRDISNSNVNNLINDIKNLDVS